jgi:hypothetical protein
MVSDTVSIKPIKPVPVGSTIGLAESADTNVHLPYYRIGGVVSRNQSFHTLFKMFLQHIQHQTSFCIERIPAPMQLSSLRSHFYPHLHQLTCGNVNCVHSNARSGRLAVNAVVVSEGRKSSFSDLESSSPGKREERGSQRPRRGRSQEVSRGQGRRAAPRGDRQGPQRLSKVSTALQPWKFLRWLG